MPQRSFSKPSSERPGTSERVYKPLRFQIQSLTLSTANNSIFYSHLGKLHHTITTTTIIIIMNFFKSKKHTATNNNNDADADPASLRKALFEQLSEGDYNKTDIERLKKEDYAVSRYFKEDPKTTIEAIKGVLEWRKQYNLSDLKEEDFGEEYRKTEVFVTHGKDVEKNVMVYIRVKLFKKGEHPIEDVKKYLAFLLDRVDRETRGDGWALCFDCTDAGISNVDMELLKFVVQALTNYFVENCRYVLIYEMPWILSSIWKIVKSWLPQDQRDAVKFAGKKELSSFIEDSQVPDFMKE